MAATALLLAAATAFAQSSTTATASRAATQKIVSRARLDEILGKSGAAVRVVRSTGVSDLRDDVGSVAIVPGDFVFRKMADSARQIRRSPTTPGVPTAAATYVMPYRWLTIDSAGVERVLVPFFILTSGGLTYDVSSRTYRGVALVGVEDTLHANASITLTRPLKLLLTTTSGGSVTPLGARHRAHESRLRFSEHRVARCDERPHSHRC
jgi:hypothetical protein